MHCRPTNILPAVIHPTKCCVKHNFMNNVVPHIHPSHTTTVNHINYQHQHYFPHTQSVVNEVTSQDLGPFPGPPPFPIQGGAPFQGPAGVPRPGVPRPGFFR
jgi:spore coat protein D